MPKNHDLFESETFQGVPMYKQVKCEETSGMKTSDSEVLRSKCKNNHVMAQTRIGHQKYWVLMDLESLKAHFSSKTNDDEVEAAVEPR